MAPIGGGVALIGLLPRPRDQPGLVIPYLMTLAFLLVTLMRPIIGRLEALVQGRYVGTLEEQPQRPIPLRPECRLRRPIRGDVTRRNWSSLATYIRVTIATLTKPLSNYP